MMHLLFQVVIGPVLVGQRSNFPCRWDALIYASFRAKEKPPFPEANKGVERTELVVFILTEDDETFSFKFLRPCKLFRQFFHPGAESPRGCAVRTCLSLLVLFQDNRAFVITVFTTMHGAAVADVASNVLYSHSSFSLLS